MLIDSVTAMQPKDSGGGGESPDQFVLNKCNDFSEKLKEVEVNVPEIRRNLNAKPAPYIKDDGRNKPDKGLAAPLNIFLFQEMERMYKITSIVKKMLFDMRDAIEGTIIMTGTLQGAIDAIYIAKVPDCWIIHCGGEISWNSDSITKWMEQFVDRFRGQSEWLEKGKLQEYRLDCFFNPQGFITSVKQEITRSHKIEKWALDEMSQITFVKAAKSNERNMPEEGVFIKGMTVEGARFNNQGLLDELTTKIYDEVPPILLSFHKPKETAKKENLDEICCCPV